MKCLLEDSDEQVDQKDVGDQEVACHEGRGEPGTRDARWELLTILIVQVLTTGCCWRKRVGVDEDPNIWECFLNMFSCTFEYRNQAILTIDFHSVDLRIFQKSTIKN